MLKSNIVLSSSLLNYFKDEIWESDNLDLAKKLYKTAAIEADGRIQFRLHSTSKPDGQLEKSSEINFEIAMHTQKIDV